MALRIGIDVGGTFTHGVVLRPPGEVLERARVPTTHSDPRGVAAGVEQVLALLLDKLPDHGHAEADVELVAHSTTQATNALLEGDLSGVHLLALVPPGERALVSRALRQRRLDIGGGHSIELQRELAPWELANAEFRVMNDESSPAVAVPGGDSSIHHSSLITHHSPVAIVQPLAGKLELRERNVAAHYRACGHAAVCASDITQVLGFKARARTAVVNAAMLPTMLATANYTEQAVRARLPHAALQVVRSDGGAMSIDEMRRQPILSLLSGPAAGASAALHRSGLSDAVFIEVGGTSTDITLIRDGRVRHRSATVGGQRLMVPALDLRTVAVGGGSMLRADRSRFGPRSAHVAGLPYLFQSISMGSEPVDLVQWTEGHGPVSAPKWKLGDSRIHSAQRPSGSRSDDGYIVIEMNDGSYSAFTLTDLELSRATSQVLPELCHQLGVSIDDSTSIQLKEVLSWLETDMTEVDTALKRTVQTVTDSIEELIRSHGEGSTSRIVGGGGGAPVIMGGVSSKTGSVAALIPDHAVISAIGAALAVTCVSLSRNVAQPSGADIAELTAGVEARLASQGAERVSTDYEYDPRRQVLTVTGRGSRPYDQDAKPLSEAELAQRAAETLGTDAEGLWQGGGIRLWQAVSAGTTSRTATAGTGKITRRTSWFNKPSAWLACATDRFGRVLWQGRLAAHIPAAPGQAGAVLDGIVARFTQHTDGGAVLPGLALLADSRLIPLDSLGSAELIAEVLRWENLPADQGCCFIVRG